MPSTFAPDDLDLSLAPLSLSDVVEAFRPWNAYCFVNVAHRDGVAAILHRTITTGQLVPTLPSASSLPTAPCNDLWFFTPRPPTSRFAFRAVFAELTGVRLPEDVREIARHFEARALMPAAARPFRPAAEREPERVRDESELDADLCAPCLPVRAVYAHSADLVITDAAPLLGIFPLGNDASLFCADRLLAEQGALGTYRDFAHPGLVPATQTFRLAPEVAVEATQTNQPTVAPERHAFGR